MYRKKWNYAKKRSPARKLVFTFPISFFLIYLLLLGGCSPVTKSKSLPSDGGNKIKDLPPYEVLSVLYEKYGSNEILKGHGNFYFRYRDEEIQGKGVVLANKIGSFRLEILSPFLQPVYVITYHEGLISFLSLRERKLYRGDEESELYRSVIPFLIDPSLFSSFIFGELPVTFSNIFEDSTFFPRKMVKGGMDEDKKLYYLKISSKAGLSYQIWVDPLKVLMVEGGIYNPAGEIVSFLKVEGFEEINGEVFPKRIKGEYSDGIVLKVDFQSISSMDSVRDESFQLSAPEGVEVFDF